MAVTLGHAEPRHQSSTHVYIAGPMCCSIQRRNYCARGWPDYNSSGVLQFQRGFGSPDPWWLPAYMGLLPLVRVYLHLAMFPIRIGCLFCNNTQEGNRRLLLAVKHLFTQHCCSYSSLPEIAPSIFVKGKQQISDSSSYRGYGSLLSPSLSTWREVTDFCGTVESQRLALGLPLFTLRNRC